MDLILLIGVALALLLTLITLIFVQKRKPPQEENVNVQRAGPVRAPQDGMRRRAEIARNQRNRLRNAAAAAAHDSSDSNEEGNEGENVAVYDEKMGAKKRAKLEAKAEKRAQREVDLHSREDKKKKEALAEEERKRQDEKVEEEERKKEELERLEREKKEREEYEEYLKMKAAFSIEEEGFEEGIENDNLLQEFIQYIKDNKVVVLEDLANQFKLKTQQAIDRITELQKNNTLTGVIDDRGKFIYISEDELKSVAKFIRQRGRISITELAESSNNLINLTPVSS